jgi:hypothetical protein
MAAATVWWAGTSWRGIGNSNVTYDFSAGTLSGRTTGQFSQSGSFLLTLSYWMPRANFPSSGCKFRSTPGANLSGNAFVSTLEGQMFGLIELSAPRAQCQLRATQQIFAGPSLLISSTLLHNIASTAGRFTSATGSLPSQPFPTLDFDLDRTQDLAIRLTLSFENDIAHSYQTWWGFPAICAIRIAQWDIVSIS